MKPQLRRNNSASCADKTRVVLIKREALGKACRHHNRAGAVSRGNDFDNDDGGVLIMMMEGAAGRMADTTAACQRCTIELLELYNRAVLSAVKAALPAVGPNSAFLMRRPNATQKFRVYFGPKLRDISNGKCRSRIWMVECQGKDDGWPENGSRRMIAKCEKGWKESSRHKMGQRMDLKMSLRTGEFGDFINPVNVAGRARTRRELLTRGTAGGHSLRSRPRRTRRRRSSSRTG